MLKRNFIGVALFFYCTLLSGQESGDQENDKLYVTDQLRLSLYASASSKSKVIKLLKSGDLLAIKELKGAYAFVTDPGGAQGWVKRGFLKATPTSGLLLKEEQQKNLELAAGIEKLANSKTVIEQYEKDMDKLVARIDELETEKQEANLLNAELHQQIEARQRERERDLEGAKSVPASRVLWGTFKRYWYAVIPMIGLVILITFLVGKVIIETRIKSKFHGIKIW